VAADDDSKAMTPMFDYSAFQPDAVILGAGDFPVHSVPRGILLSAKFLCCCDGTAPSAIANGFAPHAIVGDGDSLSPAFKARHKDILHIIAEQDDNDLTKATRFCKAKGLSRIAYVGATGRREDHTLGNISLMANYMSTLGVQPVMFTDHGVFCPCRGAAGFASFPRQQVSVFNMTCKALASEGLRYPLYAVTEWWQGTLNEALGPSFSVKGDGAYLVYQTYEAKPAQPE